MDQRHAMGLVTDDATVYDCWNRIGIRGDKSCPELAVHSHCRNCPAYSAAALTLLDRELSGAPALAAAGWLADAGALNERGTESAIIFRVGSEWFALSTLLLDEIVGPRPIHSLPHRRSPAMLGLVNVRGELVVCVSMARLLVGEAAQAEQGRLVVMRLAAGRLAFPVDEVQHTHRYRPDEVRPAPVTVIRSASRFTRGVLHWRDRIVGCLDERLLLDALDRNLA